MNATTPREAPLLSGGWPLVGHTAMFARDTLGLLFKAREECGDVARLKLLGRELILFTGPTGHEAVFRAPDEHLSPNAAYKMMVPVFGKDVAYDCEPERMREQLGMLRPALKAKQMRAYGEIIAGEVTQALSSWGTSGTIDIYDFAQVTTSFTSSHCLLGREFRMEMSDEFARVYHDLERGILPIGYINAYLPIPAFRRRDKARARLGEMVSTIIERRRRDGGEHEDFLQTLMDSTYQDGSRLTDHEITGLLVAAMFAGHHTSAVTLAWTILELVQHPELLAEIRDEIDGVLGDGEPLSLKKTRQLVKTEWAVREALRLHPPLFVLLRQAMQDTELCGYKIPKGAFVAVSPTVAHRIEDVFRNADAFDPHRFSPERAEDDNPFNYVSFGGGRHKCLGSSFALLQIKSIVAALLYHYDLELYGDPLEADLQSVVIAPKMPCRVNFKLREGRTTVRPGVDALDDELPPEGCPAHQPKPDAGGCPVDHG
jgi:sterol 14-demethylase